MKVAIASPSLDTYSETFIRTHIEQLPFEVVTLSGPRLDNAGDLSLLRESRLERLCHYPSRKLGRFNEDEFLARRQARWLASERIKVVLAEYGFTAARLLRACRLANVPLVVHFHGYDAHDRYALRGHEEEYRCLFQEAVAFVGVSQAMCQQLMSLGAPAERLHYIPYWINPDEFVPELHLNKSKTILAVGRFVEKKAPHLTILAFAKVLPSFPDANLEMAGEGPLLGPCQWLVKSLGIEEAVTFFGSKDHVWVNEAMKRSRMFVQHSVEAMTGDCEGTPVAILEAQCSGLPVVATRHTGIADVIVNGKTGFLCEEGDIDGMAENMIRVLAMGEDELREMSAAARRRIRDHFGTARTIDKLAELLKESAGSSP